MHIPLKMSSAPRLYSAALAALVVLATAVPPVFADGTETLGVPSVPIAAGSDVIVTGVGLSLGQPDDITFNVPAGASVEQVLLYWEGRRTENTSGDDTINVNGVDVTGNLIGGPIIWTSSGTNEVYRADITGLGLVGAGANVLTVGGLNFEIVNNGAGVIVIIDDGSQSIIQVRDGNDLAFVNWAPPQQATVAQTYTFAAASQDRDGTLKLTFSAVEGVDSTGGPLRPSAIDVTIDGVVTSFINVLGSNDGEEWDTITLPITVPAGVTDVTVQAFSEDRLGTGELPASFIWSAATLILPVPLPPEIEICTLVTLAADMVSGFSDADNIVGDGCDVFPQTQPVGVIGAVDGTYRLKVTNTGDEALDNVRINAPDFGLVNETIPCNGGALAAGEMCFINFGDPGFQPLKVFDVCVGPGDVNKIATVDGEGADSGIPVSDDDPAIVTCVAEPSIVLRKEVSVDGGPFLDANAPDSAPSGSLGADAEYRLIVENTGTDVLINAVITDATLGLFDVPVPGGPLAPGDIRTITSGDIGYSGLFAVDRCDSVGEKVNMARVDAQGDTTGAPVESEDPAYVNCEDPQIELLKQVSLDGVNFFDADLPGDPDVPVGIVGLTDAIYRLIVTNTGTESLTSVLIEDPTLGISSFIDDLQPGETRVIGSGDVGFGNLFVPMRCGGTPGNKSNIATVSAAGANSGTQVGDDDPANVRCIVGPEIELLKQVSLDGVNFVDADAPADGPTGLLGADATYRLIVRNVGDEGLVNVMIDDTTLGIVDALVPNLPVGAEVVIDVGSFGGFDELFFPNRCDSTGTKLNIAEVSAHGAITGTPVQDDNPAYVNCEAPQICEIEVDKTCAIPPKPGDDMLCTAPIAATTLRYTGPSIDNATVVLEGMKNGVAEYVGVDLISGTTILTMAGQNGFTIDAGDMLGAKTTITINGEVEKIHTSCSELYLAGAPAPLDGSTPNPPGAASGDPSPNWSVVNYRQKDGRVVEEPTGPGNPQDACELPVGGGDLNFGYKVTNTGTTSVDVTSVLDNMLGEQLANPPCGARTRRHAEPRCRADLRGRKRGDAG